LDLGGRQKGGIGKRENETGEEKETEERRERREREKEREGVD